MQTRPALLCCTLLVASLADAAPLELSRLQADAASALLWRQSPSLLETRLTIDQAQAESERAKLLPNPELDLQWGTLPVGTLNPPGLASPWMNVPNYTAGLSMLVELGKRGPRQRAAKAGEQSQAYLAIERLREATFTLIQNAAEIAATQLKVARLEALLGDAVQLTQLQSERKKRGDAAGLDVDRATLEEEKLHSMLFEARSDLARSLVACGELVGAPCIHFASEEDARTFLREHLATRSGDAPADVTRRPDLRALEAARTQAVEIGVLARRQSIPDPTVRVGYVRDQFIVSGNQRNSLFVGMSFPLPVFDRGQPEREASASAVEALSVGRETLERRAREQLTWILDQRALLERRRERMTNDALPLARSAVERLEQAVKAGGAPLQDLLIARRTLGDLLVDAIELDLRAVELTVSARRARGDVFPLPADLKSAL